MTRTATLVLCFVLFSPACFAVSYERQSEAIKICQQRDINNDAYGYLRCMNDAGWKFCKYCASNSAL
jgi:hypothetical protein